MKVKSEKLSSLTIELVTRYLVFDFATDFSNRVESIPSPEEFEVTDEIYEEFTNFVSENNFEYDSQTKDSFKELLETAKKEKYFDFAEEEFKALEEKIQPNLKSDLIKFKPEIKEMLEDEIVSRYYYQKGAIRASLKEDKGLQRAIEIVNNNNVYAGYFAPGTKISAN